MENGPDAASVVEQLRSVFASGKTRSVKWRIEQLKGISRFVTEKENELCEAVHKDLHKPFFESYTAEIATTKSSTAETIKSLPKWMKPEKVGTNLLVHPASAEILPEPLGVCLIIAPWNYPVWLSLEPLIGAISAGNCAVLKPSEVAQHTSAYIAEWLPKYVDPEAVKVIEGGVSVATQLLAQKWDKIFYTGGGNVARIILAAAAKHLTPVTLELGGKSPVIVDSTVDVEAVAKRIAWGKWPSNNGQACIAPDYVLAEESVVPKLVSSLKENLKAFYGGNPQKAEISRVINQAHFGRLVGMLQDGGTLDKVVHGGETDEDDLYIAPTIVLDPPDDSPIMQEEIFGPLLVIKPIKGVAEAIQFVNSRPKPLALYIFSQNKAVQDRVIQETSSGGVTINDTVLHVAVTGLPFGGVGESGMGAYHGPHSFNLFSHRKAILNRSYKIDNAIRYPPYTTKKQKLIRSVMAGDLLGVILILLGLK
ncbi:hypothetical protein R1sor_021527 [Riccia sorocarpa]|uniref:Aldehyde dehydrogenase n=1 Tax=Riccia sorocarpa TaxID=122646 RepID=A0ABD3GIZ5_9MARC